MMLNATSHPHQRCADTPAACPAQGTVCLLKKMMMMIELSIIDKYIEFGGQRERRDKGFFVAPSIHSWWWWYRLCPIMIDVRRRKRTPKQQQ
jgi:hypothetical protein